MKKLITGVLATLACFACLTGCRALDDMLEPNSNNPLDGVSSTQSSVSVENSTSDSQDSSTQQPDSSVVSTESSSTGAESSSDIVDSSVSTDDSTVLPETSSDSTVDSSVNSGAPQYNVDVIKAILRAKYNTDLKDGRKDYELITTILDANNLSYDIVWSVDNADAATIKPYKDGVRVVINKLLTADTDYTLTATINAADGSSTSVNFPLKALQVPAQVFSKITEAPVEGTVYKMYMYQSQKGQHLYATGAMKGYYMATTKDAEAAANVYVEATTDGYHIYWDDNGTKTYFNTAVNGTHLNAVFGSEPTAVWTYDAEWGTMVTTLDNKKVCLGTSGTYDTFGIIKTIENAYVGCLMSMMDRTDVPAADMVTQTKNELTVNPVYVEEAEVELPTLGDTYPEASITWAVSGEGASVSGEFPTLSLTAGETTSTATLTATITVGDVTETKEFTLSIVPNNTEAILDAVFALESGTKFGNAATLTGVIKSLEDYDDEHASRTVVITIGDKELECYRMVTACDIGVDALKAGDTVTVTGILKNHYGTFEFDQNCEMTECVPATEDSSSDSSNSSDSSVDVTEGTAGFVAADLGLANEDEFTSKTVDVVTFTAEKGTNRNVTKYYNNGKALRIYAGNVFTISVEDGYKIVDVTITTDTYNDGAYTISDATWITNATATGLGEEITVLTAIKGTQPITIVKSGTSGQFRIVEISVTYEVAGPDDDTSVDSSSTDSSVEEPEEFVIPEEGTAYNFYLYQAGNQENYYLNGEMDGSYLATTNKVADAKDYFVEAVTADSFKIYYLDENDQKMYISAEAVTGSSYLKADVKYDTTGVVFSYKQTDLYSFWYTTLEADGYDATNFVLGTHGTYTTFSLSSEYYYGSTGQYPALFVKANVDDPGTSDTGTSDTGTSDTGTSDTGTSDTGTSDTGTSDNTTSGDDTTSDNVVVDNSVISSPYTFDPNNYGFTFSEGIDFEGFKAGEIITFSEGTASKWYLHATAQTYQLRIYKDDTFTISVADGYKMTSIVITTANGKDIASDAYILNDTATCSAYGSEVTLIPTGDGKTVELMAVAQFRISTMVITYEEVSSGGTSSDTPTSSDNETSNSNSGDVVLPTTPAEIVDAAYALEEGADLEGTYTLTGVIIDINSAYSSKYNNISVIIQVDGIENKEEKPIGCWYMTGEGIENLKVGDTVTVNGTLTRYDATTVQFKKGCTMTNYVPAPKTDAEKVSETIAELLIGTVYTDAATTTLPSAGTTYKDDTTITWELSGTGAELNEGTLTVAAPTAVGEITLTATVTVNETSDTKKFTVKLIPADNVTAIVDAAIALQANEYFATKTTLTGTVTEVGAYSSSYNNITASMKIDGTETVIKLYRLVGGATLAVDDNITVTGDIINYNGTLEFNSGCTYVVVPKDGTVVITLKDLGAPESGNVEMGEEVKTIGELITVQNTDNGTTTKLYYNMVRFYQKNVLTFNILGENKIKSIAITFNSSNPIDDTTCTFGNVKSHSTENDCITLTPANGSKAITLTANSQIRFTDITVEWEEGLYVPTAEEKVDATLAALVYGSYYVGSVAMPAEIDGVAVVYEGVPEATASFVNGELVIKEEIAAATAISVTAKVTVGEVTKTKNIELTLIPNKADAIVDAAYALEADASFGNTASLTGTIVELGSYNSQYKNFSPIIYINGKEDKPIKCFRLPAENENDLKVGDTITVTGTLINYSGTIEFAEGCTYEPATNVEVSDLTKVTVAKALLADVALEITEANVAVDLPVAPAGVTYAWSTEDTSITIAEGKVSVATLPTEAATVDLTVTISAGTASDTAIVKVSVKAAEGSGTQTPAPTPVTYTFSTYTAGTQYAENEEHKLDDIVTVIVDDGHFTTQIRLYESSSHDSTAIIQSTKVITALTLNAGYKAGDLTISGSTDGETWTDIQTITAATSYKDYEITIPSGTSYTYLKLDAKTTDKQIRVASMTLTFAA